MNILVAVASRHGSTHEIAEAIAEELRATGHAVDVRKGDEVAGVEMYDAAIVGSAIYAGSWLPEARSFTERHRPALAKLPVWLFSSGPLGAENPQPQDDPQQLAAPMDGVAVRGHRVFVGKLDKRELGLSERLIARVVKAPEGDFREWEEIRAWAREIGAALPAPAV